MVEVSVRRRPLVCLRRVPWRYMLVRVLDSSASPPRLSLPRDCLGYRKLLASACAPSESSLVLLLLVETFHIPPGERLGLRGWLTQVRLLPGRRPKCLRRLLEPELLTRETDLPALQRSVVLDGPEHQVPRVRSAVPRETLGAHQKTNGQRPLGLFIEVPNGSHHLHCHSHESAIPFSRWYLA